MLTNERERAICEKYSAIDQDGRVRCFNCPLVINQYERTCKRDMHYQDGRWVKDDENHDSHSVSG